MLKQEKYLFLDRDGTLIFEPDDYQVDTLEKIKWKPRVIPALLKLQAMGYKLVMISNQDGLGSLAFPLAQFELAHKVIVDTLASQGIQFEEILICPHLPQAQCECRKPKVGLVMDYLRKQKIDLKHSYVIGDRQTDLQLAQNMGIQGILIDNQSTTWENIVTLILEQHKKISLKRKTNETDIELELNVNNADGTSIHTGIAFFDHMLMQLAAHSGIGLTLQVTGDLEVDDHHTVEDTAIVLGMALHKILGDKQGINRYGFVLPMDEALATIALDLCDRSTFKFEGRFSRDNIGGLSTECVPHFFDSLATHLKAALHIKIEGQNNHHMIEAIFKGVGRSLKMALQQTGFAIPSTKGIL